VDAGVRYLRDLLNKYDGGLWHALAAYNAGPAAVDNTTECLRTARPSTTSIASVARIKLASAADTDQQRQLTKSSLRRRQQRRKLQCVERACMSAAAAVDPVIGACIRKPRQATAISSADRHDSPYSE